VSLCALGVQVEGHVPFFMEIHAAVSPRQQFAGPLKGAGPNGSSSSHPTTAL